MTRFIPVWQFVFTTNPRSSLTYNATKLLAPADEIIETPVQHRSAQWNDEESSAEKDISDLELSVGDTNAGLIAVKAIAAAGRIGGNSTYRWITGSAPYR